MTNDQISEKTKHFSQLYFLNKKHSINESFQPGRPVILQSKGNLYEGSITRFNSIDNSSISVKVPQLGDMELQFFVNKDGYYTSGTGEEVHLLLINQTEYGKTYPELSKLWDSESKPQELLFMSLGMDVSDLESQINKTVRNERVRAGLNVVVSHPNFYNPFLHTDAVFVKFLSAEDEKHFQVEFICPQGVEALRVA